MESLKKKLTALLAPAFEAAGADPALGEVVDSQRPDLSQFQCNGAMAAAKALKAKPRDIAAKVLESLGSPQAIEKISVEGPGFLNLSVSDSYLQAHVAEAAADSHLACRKDSGEKVVVDYGGPNVAKSMHVGHLRSSIIGDSIKRVLRYLGDDVLGDVHLGDWGTQMGMLIVGVREEELEADKLTMENLELLYPAMSARCKEDEDAAEKARAATHALQQGDPQARALWNRFVALSREALERDFGDLGVSFDLWYGESRYQEKIPPMLEMMKKQGALEVSEGAQVIHLEPEKGKEIPPLLLVKSDGGYLYGTTDMAALWERIDEIKASRIIYVTDKRQGLHFRQVFAAAAKLGWLEKARVEHAAFGTMNGTDGKPFKTRAGGVLKLSDLLSQAREKAMEKMQKAGIGAQYPAEEQQAIARAVGLAAVKFADLSNHRTTDYVFDLDKFVEFEGRTGPYLLYQAVRIKSILRKAADAGFSAGELKGAGEAERPVLLALAKMPEALRAAAKGCAPNLICEMAYEIASAFSTFYQKCHILTEGDKAVQGRWLALCEATLKHLEALLDLLGLEIPERM